jgi:uncharacterized membrane protein YsdA (DUF1294 family)
VSELFRLVVPIYLITFSLVTFMLWGVDKYRARVKQWRIPERTLLILTLIGGAYGALVGMIVFRHKIRKPLFWVLVGTACILHTLFLIYSRKF